MIWSWLWLYLRGRASVLLSEGHWFDSPGLYIKVSLGKNQTTGYSHGWIMRQWAPQYRHITTSWPSNTAGTHPDWQRWLCWYNSGVCSLLSLRSHYLPIPVLVVCVSVVILCLFVVVFRLSLWRCFVSRVVGLAAFAWLCHHFPSVCGCVAVFCSCFMSLCSRFLSLCSCFCDSL